MVFKGSLAKCSLVFLCVPCLGSLFRFLIWVPYSGSLFGFLIWVPYLGSLFGFLIWVSYIGFLYVGFAHYVICTRRLGD